MLNSFFATGGARGSRFGASSSTVAPRRSGYCSVTTAGMPRIFPARNIIDETCTQWSNPWMTVRKRSWTSHTKTAVLAGSSLPGRGGVSAACAADMDRDERTRRATGRVTMRSGCRFDRPSAAVEGVSAWRHPSRDISCVLFAIFQTSTDEGTNNDDGQTHTRPRVSAAALREWRRPSSFPSRVA